MGKKSGGGMPQRQKQRALLDSESNWLDPQLERVLLEIFQRFDADGDGALSEPELQAFACASNGDGSEFEEDELEQIREYFETTEDEESLCAFAAFYGTLCVLLGFFPVCLPE